ncbi:MAG TPA: hypothetical protein VF054_15515 [Micromonosporaceae bacterium]
MRGTWHRRVDPIFVDSTGRRRRVVTMIGAALGVTLIASLGLLIAGLVGAAPVHIPGFPASGANVEQVGAHPTPGAGDRTPSPSTEPHPGLTPTPGPGQATTGTTTVTASPSKHRPTQTPDHPRPSKSR